MTELPTSDRAAEPMAVTTRIVFDEESDHPDTATLVYVKHDPDEFSTDNPCIHVDLTHAFDGTRTADEIAADVISKWVDIFCRYAAGPKADRAGKLQATLRAYPTLFGTLIGVARAHLLAAETTITAGREAEYREFEHAVAEFTPESAICSRMSDDSFSCRRATLSEEDSPLALADDRRASEGGIDVTTPAATITDPTEHDHVWERPYDTLFGSDGQRVYVQTGRRVEAIEIATGEVVWTTRVDTDYSRLQRNRSPVGATLCLSGPENQILALDTATGERRATLSTEAAVRWATLLDSDRLALVQRTACDAARSPDGDTVTADVPTADDQNAATLTVHSLATGERLASRSGFAPTAVDGTLDDRVCFLDSEGAWLTAIDARSGEDSWTVQFETGIVDVEYVEDASGADIIVCATGAGNVCGLSPADGRQVWSRAPPVVRPPDEMRRYESQNDIDADWGETTGDSPVRFINTDESASLSLVGTAQGTVTALDHETGLERWQVRLADHDVQFPPECVTVVNDTIYAVDIVQCTDFHDPVRFTAVDAIAGTQCWQTAVEPPFFGVDHVPVSDQHLLATSMGESMYLSRETGKYLLHEEVSPGLQQSCTSADGVVLATDDGVLAGIATEVLEQ